MAGYLFCKGILLRGKYLFAVLCKEFAIPKDEEIKR
jgi:hypothetical protein